MKRRTTPSTPSLWRTLIVDDHQLFRNGLRELLSSDPETEICGEAADAVEGLEKFNEFQPNFVTVDISLAKGNGLHLVERIKALSPTTVTLVLSMYDEGVYADRAVAAGASG